MIVSASFLVQPTFHKLRELLITETEINRLSPLGPRVFSGATVDTAVVITQRAKPRDAHRILVQAPRQPMELPICSSYQIIQGRFRNNAKCVFDYRLSERAAEMVARMTECFPVIEEEYEFGVGINTGFIRDELCAASKLDERYHPMVPGSGISRYGGVKTQGWIMYDPEFVRRRGKLGRSLPPERFFKRDKILVVRTRNLSLTRRIIATIDTKKAYNLNRLSNIISRGDAPLAGLLAILNSNLFNWLFTTRYHDYEIKPVYLRGCPLGDSADSNLNSLCHDILDLHVRTTRARTDHERTVLSRQIEATDREIDRLVYELYGLSEEEIAIVEEATGS
jgi:hypothetical protein